MRVSVHHARQRRTAGIEKSRSLLLTEEGAWDVLEGKGGGQGRERRGQYKMICSSKHVSLRVGDRCGDGERCIGVLGRVHCAAACSAMVLVIRVQRRRRRCRPVICCG